MFKQAFTLCHRIIGVSLLVTLLSAASVPPHVGSAYPDSPQSLFDDLFIAVQSEALYADSKAFPDAVPRGAPMDILASYHRDHPTSQQALKQFVETHFVVPPEASPPGPALQRLDISAHIDGLWNRATRNTPVVAPYASLLSLPRPYVVPGGRFREMYYWDSYFTMLGLAESGRYDLVEDMVRDFAYLIDTYGHVPNGTRSYYLSRSQPPFFFAMVGLLSSDDPAAAYARYLPQLRREYAFWMQGAMALKSGTAHRRVVALADAAILNRYWDDSDKPRDESYREDTELARRSGRKPQQLYRDIRAAAESGWDFSSRWFADGRTLSAINTTEIIPVDLNSLLFGLESAIHAGCERTGDKACVREFDHRATARRAAIDRYLWDAATGTYRDYRWTVRAQVPRLSAATLYPLFVELSSPQQAAAVASATSLELLKPGGVVTTALDTSQQWDSPNGWAPLQWIAVSGLRRYHQTRLAESIACRWMLDVNRFYAPSGKLVEKYDVIAPGRSGRGGEYPAQDGFGWTNGVMRKLMAMYPADAKYSALDECSTATRN